MKEKPMFEYSMKKVYKSDARSVTKFGLNLGSMMLIWLLLSCTSEKYPDTGVNTEMGWKPELVCPSDEGCADVEGALLFAGASAKIITPTCFESWEDLDDDEEYKSSQDIFFDCGCDRICPEDENDRFGARRNDVGFSFRRPCWVFQ
jgi:hypothetical protein